jgi:hypothetical protein
MRAGRRLQIVVVLGLLALLALGGAAMAAQPAPVNQARPVGQAAGAAGSATEAKPGPVTGISAQLILEPGEELSGDDAPAGGMEKGAATAKRANGGSCVTGAGAVLQCPKNGGPRCGSGKAAVCRCLELTNKTWTAVSACTKPAPAH